MDIERILKATCDAHSLVAVQPQGEYWATTTENKVKLWCVDGGSCVLLRGHKGRILCVAFSPMGEMVCSGAADSTLRLWHTDGGECIATLSGHAGRVQCAAFDARGMNICSGSSDGSLRIWRTMDGRCSCVLKVVPEDSEASLTACAFRPAFPGATGAIACGASDGSLWVVPTSASQDPSQAPEPVELKGHLKRVRLCIFHPAHPELLCTSSDDGTVKIWHSERGVCQQSLEGDLGEVLSLAVLPTSGHLLIACGAEPRATAPVPEGGMQRMARNTFMFLVAGAGGEKVDGIRGHAKVSLALVAFDGASFTHVLASTSLPRGHHEKVAACSFVPSAEAVCTVSAKRVCMWRIVWKAIVESEGGLNHDIAITIHDELDANQSADLAFLPARVHEASGALPGNAAAMQRGVEEETLLSGRPGGVRDKPRAKGRSVRAPEPVAARRDLEAGGGGGGGSGSGDDEDDDLSMRVSASVGWNLQPVEPPSNTSQFAGVSGVIAIPIKGKNTLPSLNRGGGGGAGGGPRLAPRVWSGKVSEAVAASGTSASGESEGEEAGF